MPKGKDYKKTLRACYLGFITQAISANYAPLLLLTFKNAYEISLGELALIPTVFYLTQLFIDFAAARFVDKIGYRTCITASQVLTAIGLALMAILPEMTTTPFVGILIAVTLYAIGSGLVEVLASPIVEACPFENKEGMMSLLHSFYCWGAVGVIAGSTLFFTLFGVENWKILTLLWAIIPLYNAFNFMSCPIEPLSGSEGTQSSALLRRPIFWLLIALMTCSGAAEASMAQWASAFTEMALGVSKTVGDLAGPCMFAAFMGVSRVMYSKKSEQIDLTKAMLLSGVLCLICYLAAALSDMPTVGLAGCAICGISVGIMWPGSISLSAQKCPGGGTAMFAFLALAGDTGATIGPAIVGNISNLFNGDLKIGLLCATAFPLILIIVLLLLHRSVFGASERENQAQSCI